MLCGNRGGGYIKRAVVFYSCKLEVKEIVWRFILNVKAFLSC